MDCRQFDMYLNSYLDGELEGTLKLEFEAHVVDCESCGHLYGMMDAMGAIVGSESPDEPTVGADFTHRVMTAVRTEQKRTLRLKKILAGTSLAASIGLILTGVIIFSSTVVPKSTPSYRTLAMTDRSKSSAMKLITPANKSLNADLEESSLIMDKDEALVSDDLNTWLTGTLERAGTSLMELNQFRSEAWEQVRQGLFKSLAVPANRSESKRVIPAAFVEDGEYQML